MLSRARSAALIQVVFGSFGCFHLFWVGFDSIKLFEKLRNHFVLQFLCKFSCLRLFHDVSHRFSCFFFRFKMEVSFGYFTLLLFVVSSFILDCFFN